MAKNNYLSKIDSLLADDYKASLGLLVEEQIGMTLKINNYGRSYLLYSFDKVVKRKKENKAIELQPYFKSIEGVKSMCDYFLFCYDKGKLFVLLIELKRGKEQVMCQLNAGNLFATYLINTLNRVEKMNLIPIIRKISIRDYRIVRIGTSMKPVVYDADSFCTFNGSSLILPEFLK